MKNIFPVIILAVSFMITPETEARGPLMDINSWAYQLQNIAISQIVENQTFELIVMDFSADGTEENKFTTEDITRIKKSGKKAIAYISIGEAENYRSYWKNELKTNPPPWLGPENPEWEGNFKVRFWYPEWQDIIFDYVDIILEQGFNGIYCDIIDAYYYWMEENPEEALADSLMIQFVVNIRNHISESTEKEFFIIPQNGEFIIHEPHVSETLKQKYFEAIDAIGVEDVFFYGDRENDNPYNPQNERIEVLKEYLNNGKNVFSIEYITDPKLIQQYHVAYTVNNFVPYITTRFLDTLYDGIAPASVEDRDFFIGSFTLSQNYPNPFNRSTMIEFTLPSSGYVTLDIFNTACQKVRVLLSGFMTTGTHSVIWDGTHDSGITVSSGVYLFRVVMDNQALTGRMVLVK
jgi:cysteinyl-tRNA synthetase